MLENEAYYKRNTCIKYQASAEFWGLMNILCNPLNVERCTYHGHLLSGRCEGRPCS